MATTPFKYQAPFPLGPDTTEYYLLTKDYVSVSEFEGTPVLKVAKEGLTAMANAAFRDVSFMLRRSHNEQVAKILSDPEASDNDKYVALTFLRNAEVAAKGVLPFCQDTGTAIIHGEKGQQVWTGYCDEEALSLGVYKTYTEENLRYSQNAPLNMYDEVNTKCNLPAQIDIEATEGMEYKFLCVTKGGGSANKTYLYQETKAILNPGIVRIQRTRSSQNRQIAFALSGHHNQSRPVYHLHIDLHPDISQILLDNQRRRLPGSAGIIAYKCQLPVKIPSCLLKKLSGSFRIIGISCYSVVKVLVIWI